MSPGRKVISIVLLVGLSAFVPAVQAQARTNTLAVYGTVWSLWGRPANGVFVKITNLANGLATQSELPTPLNPKCPGLYFCYLADLSNKGAAKTHDTLRLEAFTAFGPNGRRLQRRRVVPGTVTVQAGEAQSSKKRIDLLMC